MEQNQNSKPPAEEKTEPQVPESFDAGSEVEGRPDVLEETIVAPDVQDSSKLLPQVTQMEVHHHGHVHHDKKWKEYLFQFFMLFLAVFCGFLAEYKLEQTIEHHREEEYMTSMLQDLRSDTASFRLAMNRFNNNADIIDTLFSLLRNKDKSNTTEIYYKGREVLYAYYRLWYNNRTFDQMKNSGNLRLVRQQDVADSITAYYQRLKYLDESRELLNQRHLAVSENSSLIFDSYVLQSMVQRRPYKLIRYAGNPPLVAYTAQELNKYFESLTMMYGLELVQAKSIETNYLPQAERLIKLIEGKYQTED